MARRRKEKEGTERRRKTRESDRVNPSQGRDWTRTEVKNRERKRRHAEWRKERERESGREERRRKKKRREERRREKMGNRQSDRERKERRDGKSHLSTNQIGLQDGSPSARSSHLHGICSQYPLFSLSLKHTFTACLKPPSCLISVTITRTDRKCGRNQGTTMQERRRSKTSASR